VTPICTATGDGAGRIPPRGAVVGLLTGCVRDGIFPEVNAATAQVRRLWLQLPPRPPARSSLHYRNP
jgi:hypothetical protein